MKISHHPSRLAAGVSVLALWLCLTGFKPLQPIESVTGGSGTGGDNASVNGTAAVELDLDNLTPAAPADGVNVRWQKDTSTPNNVSGNVPFATNTTPGAVSAGTQSIGGSKTFENAVAVATTVGGLMVGPQATSIGGVPSVGRLYTFTDGGNPGIVRMHAAGNSSFSAVACGGTDISACLPTAATAGLGLDLYEYDGSAFVRSASVTLGAEGVATAGVTPSRITFLTMLTNAGLERMEITKDGIVGIGTTTEQADSALEVRGHIASEGLAPVPSACGTSPTLTGTDNAGRVALGSGTVTSCTLTFGEAWLAIPACVVNDETAATLLRAVPALTTLTISTAVSIPSHIISYICIGKG